MICQLQVWLNASLLSPRPAPVQNNSQRNLKRVDNSCHFGQKQAAQMLQIDLEMIPARARTLML
jgi:hypothetical protein